MFESLFTKDQYPSHYENPADGPMITVVRRSLLLPQKLAEACKNLDDYARDYIPAPELNSDQKDEIERGIEERKHSRELFDKGFWRRIGQSTCFRIKDGEKTI